MADRWKPATICYTIFRKTVPQYKRLRKEKWKQWGLVLVNHLLQQLIYTNNFSFTTWSTTKWTIKEIWGSKVTPKKPRKSMSHKTTSGKTPSKFAILSCTKPSISDLLLSSYHFSIWSSTTVVWSFPNKKWVILSHFSLVQNKYKDFELMLLRQICQRNHVLNYASGWSGH